MSEWLAQLLSPDLDTLSAAGAYSILFTLVFVESGLLVGFFLPGDSVLFAAGLLSAAPGSPLSLPVLVVGTAVAAVAGDAVGYWTGRRFGRPWVLRRTGRAAQHLPRAEEFYRRWGAGAVVIARFIPWVRTFTPIVAGTARMPYPVFLAANVTGALVWGAGLIVMGHVGASIPWVKHLVYGIAIAAVVGSCVVPAVLRMRAGRSARDAPSAG